MKDNAWFVGFAPRGAPEIVVVALFEHGEHGQFAAPIVRDVIKAYFDKKTRLAALRTAEARVRAPGGLPGRPRNSAAGVPAAPAASPAPRIVEAAYFQATHRAPAAPKERSAPRPPAPGP